MSVLPKGDSIQIREVWNDNLEEEFALIREIVDTYNYVAMDTEFPGVVLRPVGTFKNINDYNYQTLKDNVDMLKLIQLGLTFSDQDGNLPTRGTDNYCIWQFNFREFNISEDIFASDSIELLLQCGIDFKKNSEKGIDVKRFGELLMSSGIVLNDGVHWVTFHSGYDFGYLLKLLTCRTLPDTQAGFFDLINIYFPMVYDIKHMMKFCNSLHGGLNKLAELLEVERVGACHQAGSDSLLTSCTFRKLRDNFFSGSTEKYAGSANQSMLRRKSSQDLYQIGMHHMIQPFALDQGQGIKGRLYRKARAIALADRNALCNTGFVALDLHRLGCSGTGRFNEFKAMRTRKSSDSRSECIMQYSLGCTGTGRFSESSSRSECITPYRLRCIGSGRFSESKHAYGKSLCSKALPDWKGVDNKPG
ncbi:hypothetical protein PTKIN_Ptkin19aG0126000 [Pterospermum kingtungense]